jgi:hypothetical protein
MREPSVTSWTAGRWSGGIGRLDDPVQQVAERRQILEGNYNAGTHYGCWLKPPVSKQRRGIWTHMRKCQNDVFADDGYIELSVTKNLGDVIWVCYRKLLRWIGHR